MLMLCDAIAQAEGNASFVAPWWPQLTQWAKYLEKYGLDPGEPALHRRLHGPPGPQRQPFGQSDSGPGGLWRPVPDAWRHGNRRTISPWPRPTPQHWMEVAAEGDHYRLAFDKPETWSQKYNLVWDRILGLNIFPPSVAGRKSPITRR